MLLVVVVVDILCYLGKMIMVDLVVCDWLFFGVLVIGEGNWMVVGLVDFMGFFYVVDSDGGCFGVGFVC